MTSKRRDIDRITIALIGCGNTGRAFLRLLRSKRRELASKHELQFQLTGVATSSHGFAIDPAGIDTTKVLRRLENGKSIHDLHVGSPVTNTLEFIRHCPAEVVFEITPLDPIQGQPAIDHIESALRQGLHVVTANKGPVAHAYRKLQELADANQCCFRFEGTVMDGAPVFNLVASTLPGSRIQGFYGILNSTTNFVLTEMERGRKFQDSLERARTLGITEVESAYDIDGWDAATKTAVLANVFLGARLRPDAIPRSGIASIRVEDLAQACREGNAIRLVARAHRDGRTLKARVGPEPLRQDDPLAHIRGTSNALVLQTDTMKELTIIENDPGVEQTAYALLSDLIAITELR
jgi:homoserine dehydrogenase